MEDMIAWRREAADILLYNKIDCLDPTRRIAFHTQLQGVVGDQIRTMNVCRRIFKQDMQDIADSRVVLADIRRSSGRGTGTSMELMFAHTENKIIILWADPEDKPHPFINSVATEIHYTLEEACEAIKDYYT